MKKNKKLDNIDIRYNHVKNNVMRVNDSRKCYGTFKSFKPVIR